MRCGPDVLASTAHHLEARATWLAREEQIERTKVAHLLAGRPLPLRSSRAPDHRPRVRPVPPSEEMGTDVPTHTTAMNMNSNMGVGGGVRPVKRLRCETTVRSDSQSTEDAMETNREPTRPRLAEGLEVGDSKREMEVAGVGTGKGKGSDEGGEEGGMGATTPTVEHVPAPSART